MKRLLSLSIIALVAVSTSAQWQVPKPQDVPAYNAAPPAKGQKLPAILSGPQLSGPSFTHPAQAAAYKAAARNQSVIHQLPCFCYCDRGHGHNSLHSCFESEHGAHCSTCMQEAIFADQQVKKGKTAKQIRAAIINGEFQQVDLQKVTASKLDGSSR